MTNLIQADFNGTQVLFQKNAYLNATAIATKFGKKVNNYTRNEQTKNYIKAITRISAIEQKQLLIVKKGSSVNGGGTWLHPKLAIDFARWLSAEFAVWCDEQIENILHGKQQPKLGKTDSDDRVPLRQAVSHLVSVKGLLYPDAYALVHHRFNVRHIDELTHEQIPQAVEYIQTALTGELMPREVIEQPRLINEQRETRVAAIAMMKAGTLAKARQSRLVDKLKDLLYHARECVTEIEHCDGLISDGLTEARLHFKFAHDESKEAYEKAKNRYSRKFN